MPGRLAATARALSRRRVLAALLTFAEVSWKAKANASNSLDRDSRLETKTAVANLETDIVISFHRLVISGVITLRPHRSSIWASIACARCKDCRAAFTSPAGTVLISF